MSECFIDELRRTSFEVRESAKERRLENLPTQIAHIKEQALVEAQRGLNFLVIYDGYDYFERYPELVDGLKAEGFRLRRYHGRLTISW